ncbi:MAG: hypothetical protein H0X40_18140 [Chthoniobacterales bacterium]|nr:hypothetical protein [Chthoniobacterales bacterium]
MGLGISVRPGRRQVVDKVFPWYNRSRYASTKAKPVATEPNKHNYATPMVWEITPLFYNHLLEDGDSFRDTKVSAQSRRELRVGAINS